MGRARRKKHLKQFSPDTLITMRRFAMTRREGGGLGLNWFLSWSFHSCHVVLCLCVYSGDSIELKGIWKRNGRSRKTSNGQFRYEGKALGLQPK